MSSLPVKPSRKGRAKSVGKRWVFAASIVIVALASVIIWSRLNHHPSISGEALSEKYRYHFALIIPETDNFQWNLFQEGALAYARQNNIALEIHSPSFTNFKEQERYLEFAVLSKVDGIITSVPTEVGFSDLIRQASHWGIPVVSLDILETEKPNYVAYVGADPYQWGQKVGEALIKAQGNKAKIAILADTYHSTTFYRSFKKGLNETLSNYPGMKLELFLSSFNQAISAEEQTYDILMNHPGIDTIICINSKDTLGATRVVVDLNRLDDTTIIGSGLSPEIARYIRRGVIFGTVTTNPFYLGSISVAALQGFKEGWPSEDLTKAEMSLVTKQNLSSYNRDYHLGGTADE